MEGRGIETPAGVSRHAFMQPVRAQGAPDPKGEEPPPGDGGRVPKKATRLGLEEGGRGSQGEKAEAIAETMSSHGGVAANRKKAQRLMREMGLKGARRKEKCRSYLGHVGSVAPNLIARGFVADGPNRKRSTDASRFSCPLDKCCLSPILDMYCGDVAARGLSMSPSFEQTTRMLDRAFAGRRRLGGLILHSGMGWQRQMRQHRQRLRGMGISQSMPGKGELLRQPHHRAVLRGLKSEMFCGHESEFGTC